MTIKLSELAIGQPLTGDELVEIVQDGQSRRTTISQIQAPPQLQATYVTLTANPDLPNERVLTAGTGIQLTDAGAGGAVTLAVTAAVLEPSILYDGASNPIATADPTGLSVTGITQSDRVIAGDPGTEAAGISIDGVTYLSSSKVSDLGGTNLAQFILHRHSTTIAPVLVAARSNSDDATHALVTDGQSLLWMLGSGWDGAAYQRAAEIEFEVDGTAALNDMPGRIIFSTTPSGAKVPVERMRISQDGVVALRGAVAGPGEVRALQFQDSNGTPYVSLATSIAGHLTLRNLSPGDSMYISATLSGGAEHQILQFIETNGVEIMANAGRDIRLGIAGADYIVCDNLGLIDFFYGGSQNTARVTTETTGGFLISQTETGDTGTFRRALTSYDLGADAEFWDFDYANNVMGDPTQARFRLNNSDPTLVTAIALDDQTISDRDFGGILSQIQSGTQITLTETTDLGRWVTLVATAPATDNTGWWEIPVAYVAHAGTFPGTTIDPFKFTFTNLSGNPAVGAGGFIWDTVNVNFDSTTDGLTLPGVGEANFNNATPSLVTLMQIDDEDADGNSLDTKLGKLAKGSLVRLEATDDPTIYNEFTVTTTTDQISHWDITLKWVDGSDTFPADTESMRMMLRAEAWVPNPTTENAVLRAETATGGSPTNGWVEETQFRLRAPDTGSGGFAIYDGATLQLEVISNANITSITAKAPTTSFLQLAGDRVQVRNEAGSYQFVDFVAANNNVTWGNTTNSGHSHYYYGKAAASGNVSGTGQIYVQNSSPTKLWFVDDAGNAFDLTNPGASAVTISSSWSTGSGGSITLAANAGVLYTEQTNHDTIGAGQGQIWVKDDTTQILYFTDDAANDRYLAGPLFEFDGTTLDVVGNIHVQGGNAFRVYDAGDDDFLDVTHSGSEVILTTAGTGAGSVPFNFDDINVREMTLQDYQIESDAPTVVTNAVTLTYANGPVFEIDLEPATGTVTVTLSGGPITGTHGQITVKVQQDGTAARTITWAGGTFRWAGGSAHPMNSTLDGFSIFTFESWDGGTTWYASGADYS